MKKIAQLVYSEPVVTLGIATGVTGVLAEQHLVPAWVPLVALAIVTPIQRGLVTPVRNRTVQIMRRVRSGGANSH